MLSSDLVVFDTLGPRRKLDVVLILLHMHHLDIHQEHRVPVSEEHLTTDPTEDTRTPHHPLLTDQASSHHNTHLQDQDQAPFCALFKG